jgi:hypothetical protein
VQQAADNLVGAPFDPARGQTHRVPIVAGSASEADKQNHDEYLAHLERHERCTSDVERHDRHPFMLGPAELARGQATSGTIPGLITDSSGAVVPGVAVSITTDRTGLTRSVTTASDGRYLLSNLPPDTYSLTATLQGFRAAKRPRLTVSVDQQLRIDFTLELGNVTDVVDVVAETPLLQTQSAATGEVIEQRQIQDLPLLGRNFLELARLTVGTTAGQGGNPLDLSVNGQREFGNSVMVDGVEVTGLCSQ